MLSPQKSSRAALWAALLFAAVLLTHFWPVVFAGHRLAFRDVSHFYLPLYEHLAQRIAAGELPLWNPLDLTGIPVAGEATTGLFYPPTLLFWIGTSTAPAMGAYVLLHLALAAAGTWRLARAVGIRPPAATLAMLGYAFATPVVFLYCNPPFLVGAAWLPWQLAGLWHVVRDCSLRTIARAAAPAALSILGGDPQTVAHVWLVVVVALALASLRRLARRVRERTGHPLVLTLRRFCALGGVAAVALAASAIQVWPSAAWARNSWREASSPPTLYTIARHRESPESPENSVPASWWQSPAAGTHAAAIYRFSVAPWHYLTLVLPNVYGNLFPINSRWSGGIPGEPAMWTPSCYGGLLIAVGALAGFTRIRFRTPKTRTAAHFCRFSILISVLAGLGEFGLVRVLQSLAGSDLGSAHGAIGGLYWLLVTFVPLYANFRYPAKWLVPLALALAVLAAATVDSPHARRRLATLTSILLAVLILAGLLAISPAAATLLRPAVDAAPADEFWGPVTLPSALAVLRCSVVSATGVCVLLLLALRRERWQWSSRSILLAALLACDLVLANSQLIATIPVGSEAGSGIQLLRSRAGAPAGELSGRRIVTGYDRGDWPEVWRRSSSEDRVQVVELSQRAALFGRWHLPRGVGQLDSVPSLVPARTRLFLRSAASTRLLTDPWTCDATTLQRFQMTSGATARLALVPPASPRNSTPSDPPIPTVIVDACDPAPDAFLYDRWREVPPLEHRQLEPAINQLLTEDGGSAVASPLVERRSADDVHPQVGQWTEELLHDRQAATPRRVPAAHSASDHVEFEIATSSAVLLYRPAFQDGYWTARLRGKAQSWQQLEVHPTNLIGQSVVVPAGRWLVRFEYKPTWLVPAGLFSLVSWIFITFFMLTGRLRASLVHLRQRQRLRRQTR